MAMANEINFVLLSLRHEQGTTHACRRCVNKNTNFVEIIVIFSLVAAIVLTPLTAAAAAIPNKKYTERISMNRNTHT